MNDVDHITLMYLKMALREPGCPVCRVAHQAEDRYLRFLLWENVNDMETRIRISEAMGFCRRHAWTLYRMEIEDCSSPLGNSIIYEDLVRQAMRRLATSRALLHARDGKGGPARFWAVVKGWLGVRVRRQPHEPLLPNKACRACESGQQAAENGALTLVRMLSEEEYRALYANSDGCCLPHLRLALQVGDSLPGMEHLISITQERLARLQLDLAEYGRKQAWQYREEAISPAEQEATERAVAFVAGQEMGTRVPRAARMKAGREANVGS